MSGIYIHIPFCKKACHYCNFHFSTSLVLKKEVVRAICSELEMRADYLADKRLDSVYFGGGTPSLLSKEDMESIMETIQAHFKINSGAEITLEANPDDLNSDALIYFQQAGINRLSIGIQSFFDEDLSWMNRSHTAIDAKNCIRLAQKAGIENVSVDLIYGSPTTTNQMWLENIREVISMGVPHISAYCLTVEEKTALHHFIQKKQHPALDANVAGTQFSLLQEEMEKAGYLHYEISNFCQPGMTAVHNTSYWSGKAYLGIGPSAHSFDGKSRSWNVANNKKYVDEIHNGNIPCETEILSMTDTYNEYIMTGLRTMWGINQEAIEKMGEPYLSHFIKEIINPLEQGHIRKTENNFTLTLHGKHFADGVSAGLFYID